MAQNIKLKRSSVSGKVPTTAQLQAGEIAINTADGKLYFERDDTSIQTIVTTNALITGSLNINGTVTATSFTGSFSGSASAPGSTTQIVYNSGGALAADSGFVYSGSRVGIGTTTPAYNLDVVGNGRFSTNIDVLGIIYGLSNKMLDQSSTYTRLYDAAGTLVMSLGSGNVGIGVTNPTDKLAVDGNVSIFSTNKLYNGSAADSAGISFPSNVVRIDGYSGITFNSSTTNIGSQTERMRITDGGNVGIGTTSPGAKLQVKGDGGTTGITFQTTDLSNNQIFYVLDGGRAGTKYYPFMIAHSSSVTPTGDPYLQVATNALYVSSSGNVGIGTASPSNKLQVVGGITATSFTGSFSGSASAPGSTTQVVFNNGGVLAADSGLVYSGSNVGIGTTSPFYKLDVAGEVRANNLFRTTDGTNIGLFGSSVFASNVIGIGSSNAVPLVLGTAATERMRITSGGNVVINSTTTPYVDDKLYIAVGNVIIDNNKAYLQYTTAGARATVLVLNSSNNLSVGQNNANNASLLLYGGTGNVTVNAGAIEVARFTTAGNVGIGTTSPASKLHISNATGNVTSEIQSVASGANAILKLTSPSNNWQIINDGTSANLDFKRGGSSVVYFKSDGNVGIGTTSPGQKLEVNGNAIISGSLSLQGNTTVVQEGILVSGTTSLTVKSISTGSYEGAFLDYLIVSGSNKRAGTLTSVWTASDIEWKDVSTLDLGSTEGAEFTPTLAGSNANIVLAVPVGTWTVKGHLRYM